MNSAQFNLSRILGPTIAGFGLKYVGAAGCFFLNALSFLALLYALTLLRLRPPPGGGTGGMWGPLREGFVYIRGHRSLAMLMILVAVASLCAVPYATLMPAFARDVLKEGPEGLGYLMGSSGAGALAGAFLLARSSDRPRKGARLLNGFLLLYASLIVFCLLRHLILCAVALFFTGAAMVTAVSAVNNLLQKYVTDQVRGRVMAMHATAFLGFAPIGSLIGGSLAHSFGVPAALLSLCAAALLFTLLVPVYMPEIKELA
jgi:predicted MFS family arabinose efflux permease